MTGLLGQGDEFARLLADAGALRIPHGLVIEGVAGCGKSTAARLLARHLLCGDEAACGSRVAAGAHADLHLVELPPDRQDIPVDRVRELQGELERRPVEGRARVAILDPADRLNEQGQNALLKTLEEPGEHTFLLLVTSRPEALLETVRSRCRRLRVRPLDQAALRAALEPPADATAEEIDLAVAAAGGSLGLARELLGAEARGVATRLAAFLSAPTPAGIGELRALLDGASGRTETEQRIALVCRSAAGWLRARALVEVADRPADPDSSVAAGRQSGYRSALAEPWVSAIEAVFEAEQDLAMGIPAGQVLDGLFLRIVTVLGRGAAAS